MLRAFSQSVSRDLLATAPLFPLEAELGFQWAEHGEMKLDPAAAPEANDTGTDDVVGRFVREMYNLENRMHFVGSSMLCHQWVLDWGLAWNEHESRRLVDAYHEVGIIERHDVINTSNPDWPTSAVRLVRTNETVRQVLGFSDGPVSNPVLAR